MTQTFSNKSSIDDIRRRFDNDVDRFSNLETGQSATVDAPLAMTLITQAAVAATPNIKFVLDIGCGAGNNSIKLAESTPNFNCDLVDLSLPMLQRAQERVSNKTSGVVQIFQGDIRQLSLEQRKYDVVLAAAVLHHLRDENDWFTVFSKIYSLIAPGGSFWITDLVIHDHPAVQSFMWQRYGDYLTELGGPAYRDQVFEYIEIEDTPRSVPFQLNMLKRVGFAHVEILHKNACFAAFGAVKSV